MLEASDLRNRSAEDLEQLFAQLSRELFQLRSELAVSRKVEKPHLIRAKRRARARIRTILTERATKEEARA